MTEAQDGPLDLLRATLVSRHETYTALVELHPFGSISVDPARLAAQTNELIIMLDKVALELNIDDA